MSPDSSVWDEHARLNERTARIARTVSGPYDAQELDAQLADLEASLLHHFEHEEQPEQLGRIARHSDIDRTHVDRLLRDHESLRSVLRDIRQLVSQDEPADTLKGRVLDWIQLLSRHEAYESRLILGHELVEPQSDS